MLKIDGKLIASELRGELKKEVSIFSSPLNSEAINFPSIFNINLS
jgi:hypothetical protein